MMECNRFNENLEMFADGELDRGAHEDAIDHFHSCDECQDRIEQIQQMKDSLERVWSRTHALASLRKQIIEAMDNEPIHTSNTYDDNRPLKHVQSASTKVSRSGLRKWILPSTIAVAIIVAVTVLPSPFGDSDATTYTFVPARALEAVVDQHRICSANGGVLHHDKDLTRDLATISQKLSGQLSMSVFVPDLSDQGYEMVGANRCGIKNHPGSHILYRSGMNTMLSVFTVHRLDGLTSDKADDHKNHHYFVSDVQNTSVVVWHENKDSHVICGKIARPKLIELIEGVRTASVDHQSVSPVFLAKIHY